MQVLILNSTEKNKIKAPFNSLDMLYKALLPDSCNGSKYF